MEDVSILNGLKRSYSDKNCKNCASYNSEKSECDSLDTYIKITTSINVCNYFKQNQRPMKKQINLLLDQIRRYRNANDHDGDMRTVLTNFTRTLTDLNQKDILSEAERISAGKIAIKLAARGVISENHLLECTKIEQ